jgi:hypothetical protein
LQVSVEYSALKAYHNGVLTHSNCTTVHSQIPTDIGHLQKPVTASNFLAETKTQLFSHHTMEQEAFKVDAFRQRDDTGMECVSEMLYKHLLLLTPEFIKLTCTGILGRMADVLGKSMSTSRIAIDGSSNNLFGDPAIGLEVDVIAARGPDQFYVNDTFSLRQVIDQLNNKTIEGSSSIHADLWSQSLIDSKDKSDRYVSLLDTVSDSSIDLSFKLGKQLNMVYKLIKLSKFKYS